MAKYKIIWADDEVHGLLIGAQDNLNELDFEVIACCTCGQALEKELRERAYQRIDAVIVDANFPDEDEDEGFHDRQIDGLDTAIVELNRYPHIPFYIFSGKGKLVANLKERIKKHFSARSAIFDKDNGIEPLLQRIKEDVEYRKTTVFSVDNNFSDELGYAQKLDRIIPSVDAEKFIRTNLIRSFDNRWDFQTERPQEMLNTARKIVEAMFSIGKEWGILPPIDELNGMSKFLQGKNEDFKHTKIIMPKPLARALWYYLDITQDGSHLKGDLKLGVDAYVTEVQNANILRSVLHIAIELIRWFVLFEKDCKTETGVNKLWYQTNKSE